MSERTESSSPDELVLLHSLERLRTREGLTPQRLVLHRDDVAAPLLGLAAVRRVAARRQVSVAEATLDVVRSAVREASLGRDRVVADAVLGLGAFEQQYLSAGVDAQVVWAIGSDSLGRRRQSLLAAWGRLHEGLGVGVLPAPSDRQLRGPVERQALLGLSRLLLRVDGDAVLAKAAPDRPIIGAASPGDRPRGRVVVVGGAVMDAVFSVTEIPQAQTSEEASGFRLSPGGKGLTQAVAAARLGLEVAFVGAVADDVYADQIVGILTDRGIDTSLLKRIPGERTPFTAVVENELGESLAANWRNESRVRFGVRDVDESVLEALAACDAVLISFDVPRLTVQHVLASIHELDEARRPIVIVTPGQPYKDGRLSNGALSQIDYLVPHQWELKGYLPMGSSPHDVPAACRHLLTLGVGNVCMPQGTSCYVYSDELGAFQTPAYPSFTRESSVARDAFCAALALRLIEADGAFNLDLATWAAAAAWATVAENPLPRSVPDRRRVDEVLRRAHHANSTLPRGGASST